MHRYDFDDDAFDEPIEPYESNDLRHEGAY